MVTRLRVFLSRLISSSGRRERDAELRREIDAHIAEAVDEFTRQGMSPADARQAAMRQFGGVTQTVEAHREHRGFTFFSTLWQDLRYAVRALVRQPAFSSAAILVLALGIALPSALFVVFNAEVLRSWPVPNPGAIAIVHPTSAPGRFGSLSLAEYQYLREHTQVFENLATNLRGGGPITDGTVSGDIQTNFVTYNYFATLGVRMLGGRDFSADDENYRRPKAVAIASEWLWREQFGSDPTFLGRTIRVSGQPFQIVGIAQTGFRDVSGRVAIDLWMPLPSITLQSPNDATTLRMFTDSKAGGVFGRLKAGRTRREAQTELELLSRQFRAAAALPPQGLLLTDTRPIFANPGTLEKQVPLMVMTFAALGLVLLVACANAGNLILARSLARRREIAVRVSLGASRRRVVRQLLTESLLLSLAAGGLGLAIGAVIPRTIQALLFTRLVPSNYFAPDGMVVAFVLVVSALACLVAGVAPALRLTRPNLATDAGNRHPAGPVGGRLRAILLASQMAVTMVLLTGACLFTRAIGHAMDSDPGFAIDRVSTVVLPGPRISAEARNVKVREWRAAIETIHPARVAFCDFAPFNGASMILPFRQTIQGQEITNAYSARGISGRYFEVLGIPLVAGRTISEDPGRREVVISETLARMYPEGRALGQTVTRRGRTPDPASVQGRAASVTPADSPVPDAPDEIYEIVGIAKDVPVRSIDDIGAVVYWPASAGASTLLIRDATPAAIEQIRATTRAFFPDTGITISSLRELLSDSLSALVIGSRLAWAIGLLALMLATIGAFGVFAYMVEERRREIGVRMALGAQAAEVIRFVLAGASRPVIAGLVVGLVLAMGASSLLRSVLYGLSPFDPIAYLEIAVILIAAATIATWIPATRATRIDPVVALRDE